MNRLLRRLWPSTLRMQLMLVLLPVVALPIVVTGYALKLRGQEAIFAEKRQHLQGINALLALHLQAQGGYRKLLAAAPADREGRIRHLNGRLRSYTDEVARAFPDVGVGYYHRELNAIITYGPSAQYDKTVGISIPADHPGWKVMTGGTPLVHSGEQVRGQIMNAMLPIREDDRVVGYIWANEFLDDIERQLSAMRWAVYSMTLFGFALACVVVFFAVEQLTRNMEKIKEGLRRLRFDLSEPIRPLAGEVGEMVEAINGLARALLETRSMHHNILDSLSDAVITVDASNVVTYVNPAGCELFRCRAAEVVGQPYSSLFRSDAKFVSPIVDTLQTGREHHGIELDYPLPDRTPRVMASTSVLFDGRGNQLGVVAIIRDISETYSLRRQLARADRLAAIGEVAAGIAHELRTPLTSIRGFVQYLQGSREPREWREYGDVILREVDGLNRIVSELLDLVRPRPLNPEPIDINALVEQTLLLARDSASGRRIAFALELGRDLPPVEVDSGQIKQVILNIVVNAIQSITGDGEIRITTTCPDGAEVMLAIADNGSGMSAAVRDRIFDPFFSTKPTGTGLGMPIARRIIEGHHGRIDVDSAEGRGTTVTLALPVRREELVQ